MDRELFRRDAYLQSCQAQIVKCVENAIILDRTVFYPTGGGQPGDLGIITLVDGTVRPVLDARKDEAPGAVLHILENAQGFDVGARVNAQIDWRRRHRLMRMHTCLHLLCRAVDGAVTGGQIGEAKSRLDFDIPEPKLDKEAITLVINRWIDEDHAVSDRWISSDELEASPELVRTMSVHPPISGGAIRLVEIDGVDLQACGGTHVRSTREIGPVRVAKIEKKGRQNRRVSIVFEDEMHA